MIIRTEEDLSGMREAGKAVAQVREYLKGKISAGITTKELDELAGKKMKELDLVSAPRELYRFPGNICISVNDCVAHGIPNEYILREGDAINIDISGAVSEYYGDTGVSLIVGEEPQKQAVVDCAKGMFQAGLSNMVAKSYLQDMATKMEQCAVKHGFSVIEKLCGHGIGKKLHDAPHNIYCHPYKWDRRRFRKGMVVAIETFVAQGNGEVYIEKDGWSWVTKDHSIAAQYEHTLLITEGEPEILTQ